MPFLRELSNDDKRDLPKFGDKSVAFVNKAAELVRQKTDFLPRNFNESEFLKDVNLYSSLYSILQPLRMLMSKLEDTFYEVGAEAYSAALVVYQQAKLNESNLIGLEPIIDDMAKRFIQKSLPAEEETAE